ncbi:hypothetical protein JCGZ_15504 [Jatropha curcas]|uniref:Uncharacterized protein n=1 Tax=Jatropha curcas TaxID=180498 RepID=A0A067KF56_JATCU|nr:hypothetical protein JCGZ_15504 [Jatropha curcas]
MKFAIRALNAKRPPSSFFFFLSSPPPLLSSARSAAPALPNAAPACLTLLAPLHCNSSHSIAVWTQVEAEKLGREPTPIEVFTYTHTKDHDLNTFVDRRAENYTSARKRVVSSQTDESEAESRIDEASQFYFGSASHASAPNAGPQLEHTAEEFIELWARVDDQQRQIAELRAHVMRLSGEPGAGSSSSDPAPATDRNVSTSQQQPLSSPDPDATDDTLVTPPGTTAHPAGTPLGDLTSDRANEQPRRFDFGPFLFFICFLTFCSVQ